MKLKISRYTLVFHNFFSPFQSLFKLPKISIKFMFTPALKEDNFEYSWRLNQVFNARNINLISIQVKMRVLTCLFKGNKKPKIIQTKCSSFSAPPYPPHGVELTGAESLQSPTLTGPPARGASNTPSMRLNLNKRWKALCLPFGRHFLDSHEA